MVTHCATVLQRLLELVELNLITNYLVLASIKTTLFFALSIKLAGEFLGSVGTTTIPLVLTNVSGSIGNSFLVTNSFLKRPKSF